MSLADLDVVAEHLVVADLQGRDAGPVALGALDAGQQLLAATGESALLIELGIPAGTDDAVADDGRWFLGQTLMQQACDVAKGVDGLCEHGEAGGSGMLNGGVHCRHEVHTGTQCMELPRHDQGEPDPGGQPFEVGYAVQRIADSLKEPGVLNHLGHGPVTVGYDLGVDARSNEPVAQPARAHPGQGVVEHADQARAAGVVG